MEEKTYVKLYRTDDTIELLKSPKTFTLYSIIALRARRTDALNIKGLNVGEAFLGDHETVGLSRQEYRTGMKKLKKLGLISYKTTNKGTIATIINTDIYDINVKYKNDTSNQQATGSQPTCNQQITGNKNVLNVKMINDKEYESNKTRYPKNSRGIGNEYKPDYQKGLQLE